MSQRLHPPLGRYLSPRLHGFVHFFYVARQHGFELYLHPLALPFQSPLPLSRSCLIHSSPGVGAADEDDSESVPNSAAAVATAKSKLLTQVARKAVVESIVPIVIELKRYLERQRSPLLRDIFLFLREVAFPILHNLLPPIPYAIIDYISHHT